MFHKNSRFVVLALCVWSVLLLSQSPSMLLAQTDSCGAVSVDGVSWSREWSDQFDLNAWSSHQAFGRDPIYSVAQNSIDWAKFTIANCDPETVYFQDRSYDFHYEFAAAHLTSFMGMGVSEFNEVALTNQNREAYLGTLLKPKQGEMEYGVQFVSYDIISAEELIRLIKQIDQRVNSTGEYKLFYMPTFEQNDHALANRALFEENGIEIGTPGRWSSENRVSNGWAVGELVYIPGKEIDIAFQSGQLQPDDILLTDAVPAEIPTLAGAISLSPITPNSHVALLAKSYGIPLAYVAGEDAAAVEGLVGRTVAFDTTQDEVIVHDLSDADPDDIAQLLSYKQTPVLEIQPMETVGVYVQSTEMLSSTHITQFGGKASNSGYLRRAIPDNSPVSAAISFDLWQHFMDQTLDNGVTLREEIDARLAGQIYPPSDAAQLSETLQGIRDLIKDVERTAFAADVSSTILTELQSDTYGFDINKKIRFRSSTNVEDSSVFMGAGLYNSYSGCLADELDTDSEGPSLCDPEKLNERGVFRAIRKVFASFYNDNAYLERLRYHVDEHQVGMAILVHHSFPDEIEMANGVAIVEHKYTSDYYYYERYYPQAYTFSVQTGAISVANPEENARPEVTEVHWDPYWQLEHISSSNLLLLGETVLTKDEYKQLSEMMESVRYAYDEYGLDLALDFEFKKIAPDGKLIIKQVREIPQPEPVEYTPFLLAEKSQFDCVRHNEVDRIFSVYRLKSNFAFEHRSQFVDDTDQSTPLFSDALLSIYPDQETTLELPLANSTGQEWVEMATLTPGYVSEEKGSAYALSWDSIGPNYDEHTITVRMDGLTNQESPFVNIENVQLTTTYQVAQPMTPGYYSLGGDIPVDEFSTKIDDITLIKCHSYDENGYTRDYAADDGLVVKTSNFVIGGDRNDGGAEVVGQGRTTVTGLTAEPLLFKGEWSQTIIAGHHHFYTHVLLDPYRETSISDTQLQELRDRNIGLILMHGSLFDMEGAVRVLPLNALLIEEADNSSEDESYTIALSNAMSGYTQTVTALTDESIGDIQNSCGQPLPILLPPETTITCTVRADLSTVHNVTVTTTTADEVILTAATTISSNVPSSLHLATIHLAPSLTRWVIVLLCFTLMPISLRYWRNQSG